MRYKKKNLKTGDTRIIHKFLLFPKTISGETRWLETVRIKQLYICGWIHPDEWVNLSWED